MRARTRNRLGSCVNTEDVGTFPVNLTASGGRFTDLGKRWISGHLGLANGPVDGAFGFLEEAASWSYYDLERES